MQTVPGVISGLYAPGQGRGLCAAGGGPPSPFSLTPHCSSLQPACNTVHSTTQCYERKRIGFYGGKAVRTRADAYDAIHFGGKVSALT